MHTSAPGRRARVRQQPGVDGPRPPRPDWVGRALHGLLRVLLALGVGLATAALL
ncbi:MAG: hypothetical protein HOP14_10010 [Acidobacteria bacterium]|nr:hypothetical protein [Acidobacteriota bacterium]